MYLRKHVVKNIKIYTCNYGIYTYTNVYGDIKLHLTN